jgi:hypothetical protein
MLVAALVFAVVVVWLVYKVARLAFVGTVVLLSAIALGSLAIVRASPRLASRGEAPHADPHVRPNSTAS